MVNPLLIQVLVYFFIFIASMIVFNLLTRGFLLKYLNVKASRGAKVLVKVRAPFEDYFSIGVPSEGQVRFKDRSKEFKRVSMPRQAIIKFLGVYWLEVDEESGAVVLADFSAVTGHDPVKNESLYERCLMKPSPNSKRDLIVYIGLGLIIILLIVVLVQIAGVKDAIPVIASVTGANI